MDLLQQGYREQMAGNLDAALRLYQASLACYPTGEAHRYLGWAYSCMGNIDAAIAECKRAIDIDPGNGSPYNDIGSYLIHQGKHAEAMPWLERALAAERCEPRHYPYCNLGRVYRERGMLRKAIEQFEIALSIEPTYDYAREALAEVQAQLQ
jgi:tetratricopeptide (TPR) repeat protein